METTEFNTVSELEDLSHSLARASRHPVYTDLTQEYSEEESIHIKSPSQLEDLNCLWNNRDNRRSYIGTKKYNLIQHREVIDAIRDAVDMSVGSIEKGILRDYGEHINGVLIFSNQEEANINVEELIGGDYMPPEGSNRYVDTVGLGMRFWNSFDGRSKFGGSVMAYRFICQNWMVWGEEKITEKEDYHIKGSSEDIGIDPEYFVEAINTVFDRKEMVEDAIITAEHEELPVSQIPNLLDSVGFGKNYQRKIVYRLLQQVDTHSSGYTTLWRVYNAATYHLDHDRVTGMGPEPYNIQQSHAWDILSTDVDSISTEEQVNIEEFALQP